MHNISDNLVFVVVKQKTLNYCKRTAHGQADQDGKNKWQQHHHGTAVAYTSCWPNYYYILVFMFLCLLVHCHRVIRVVPKEKARTTENLRIRINSILNGNENRGLFHKLVNHIVLVCLNTHSGIVIRNN